MLSAVMAIVGFFVGFYTVFAYSFSDHPTGLLDKENLMAYAIVLVVYAVVTMILARLTGKGGWWWLAWFGGPGLILLVLYGSKELQAIQFHLTYAALLVAGCLGGTWLGIRWLAMRNAQQSAKS